MALSGIRRVNSTSLHATPVTASISLLGGPPDVQVLFCSLASVVCNAAGRRAGRPPGAWAADTAQRASTVTSR